MKQRGDDYGSTLSLLNMQNGLLLLPLTCVLSIFEDEKRSYSSNLVCFLLMNAMQAVHKLLVLRHRYQSSICSVKTQIFIFLGSKPMERRKKFNCFFWICIQGWLNFSSKIEKNKGDRDFKLCSHIIWTVFLPQVLRYQYIGENVIAFVPQPGDQVQWKSIDYIGKFIITRCSLPYYLHQTKSKLTNKMFCLLACSFSTVSIY